MHSSFLPLGCGAHRFRRQSKPVEIHLFSYRSHTTQLPSHRRCLFSCIFLSIDSSPWKCYFPLKSRENFAILVGLTKLRSTLHGIQLLWCFWQSSWKVISGECENARIFCGGNEEVTWFPYSRESSKDSQSFSIAQVLGILLSLRAGRWVRRLLEAILRQWICWIWLSCAAILG